MKIYQLCFPDGYYQPIIPLYSFTKIPSIELLNEKLKKIISLRLRRKNHESEFYYPIPQFTKEQYDSLIKGYPIDLNLYIFSFLNNSCQLTTIEVIEN